MGSSYTTRPWRTFSPHICSLMMIFKYKETRSTRSTDRINRNSREPPGSIPGSRQLPQSRPSPAGRPQGFSPNTTHHTQLIEKRLIITCLLCRPRPAPTTLAITDDDGLSSRNSASRHARTTRRQPHFHSFPLLSYQSCPGPSLLARGKTFFTEEIRSTSAALPPQRPRRLNALPYLA